MPVAISARFSVVLLGGALALGAWAVAPALADTNGPSGDSADTVATDPAEHRGRWQPPVDWSSVPIEARKYTLNCAGCHGVNGDAQVPAVPYLRDFSGYFARTARGREFLIRSPGNAMSPLNDQDLADVTNWWLKEFSAPQLPAGFEPFTVEEVSALRVRPLTWNYVAERKAVVAELRAQGLIPEADMQTQRKETWILEGTPSSVPPGILYERSSIPAMAPWHQPSQE